MSQTTVGSNEGRSTPTRDQLFNQFCKATDFLEIVESFQTLCNDIGIDPSQSSDLYPTLRKEVTSWRALNVWRLLDAKVSRPEYEGQKACEGKRVLVIGAGPVGLRSAIEAALLGAKVEVVEKRTSFSRNNTVHLWPFVITDLRNLAAKEFYAKFCPGNINHICIRFLQGILLKVCLLFGVQVHRGVAFKDLVEPAENEDSGWGAAVIPDSSPVTAYQFDIIVGADGRQNTLPGFKQKEYRGKLALAITANFVYHRTTRESRVPEIGGLSFIFKQDFFKTMAKEHGIDLENFVYFKDETHYFVMTAKKKSLLTKGVLKKDKNDPKQLLESENIDHKTLEDYVVEAVTYATEGALGDVEFEKNHRGENDVALFDFTSMYAAENASRVIERKGKRLLLCIAGDALLQPFWPTGTGCGRGFLSLLDNAWMMKQFAAGTDPVEFLKEREAILGILAQTAPTILQKNVKSYTIDPSTRYFNVKLLPRPDVSHLIDTKDSELSAGASCSTEEEIQPSEKDVDSTEPCEQNCPDNDSCVR